MAHILIDGEALFRRPDGVGRFAQQLIGELAFIDQDNQYTVIGFARDLDEPHLISDDQIGLDFQYLPLPRRLYSLLFKFGLKINIGWFIKKPVDLILYPNFVAKPYIKDVKKVLVIHDLAYIDTPEMIEGKNLRYLKKFVPKSIRQVDKVTAVSEFTRDDLIKKLGVAKSKIAVVPNAVDERFFNYPGESEIKRVRNKLNLPERFLLHVGTLEPRKNHIGLLDAYKLLDKKVQDRFPLVLAGGYGWKNEEITSLIDQMNARGERIIVLGKVIDDDLAPLYHAASAFALPSHFEGFGIPLAEAMAAGLPSITSNKGPTVELAGDAAILVDPDDAKSIAKGLNKILTDKSTRQFLTKAAPKQISSYTWNKSAQRMKKIIEELI